jgi:hypothetical protein
VGVRLSALANRSRGDVFALLQAVLAVPDVPLSSLAMVLAIPVAPYAPFAPLSSLVYFLKLFLIENRENRNVSGIFRTPGGLL